MKNIVVLGSTGSIGTQTLDIVRRVPDLLRIVGLSGHRNTRLLQQQAAEFDVPEGAVALGTESELVRLATLPNADLVVVAVAGAAGTRATLAALEAGKDVALATKEVMVAAGQLVMRAAQRNGVQVLPIDSEHSAVFQCLQGSRPEHVAKILLTASGGPFRTWPAERIAAAKVADALTHPTWPEMGKKITIDSATLMNKGLEIIEAHWLFNKNVDCIDVVIHPQSVVHSFVEFTDGSVLAQLGLPDMRLPIEYALLYPRRVDAGIPRLSITDLSEPLTFEKPDHARFPALGLARRAAAQGGTMPASLNAANEAAVELFLNGDIAFPEICGLVERVMDLHQPLEEYTLDNILEVDSWSRATARTIGSGHAGPMPEVQLR